MTSRTAALSGPPPPEHLGPDGRRLWQRVHDEYALADAAGLELLRLAAEALDRCAQARAALATGLTISGRFGEKLRPEVAVEANSALRCARLLRELGISLDAPASRPPTKWR
jgi:hypothetical protein